MKGFFVSASFLCLLFLVSICWGGTSILYDKHGDRQVIFRETDKAVRIYNGDGDFVGRITRNSDSSRTLYDEHGRYEGHVTCYGGCDPKSGEDD